MRIRSIHTNKTLENIFLLTAREIFVQLYIENKRPVTSAKEALKAAKIFVEQLDKNEEEDE